MVTIRTNRLSGQSLAFEIGFRLSANRDYSEIAASPSHKGSAILSTVLLLIITGITIAHFRDYHIVSVATTAIVWLLSSSSLFRFTILVGFGGSLLSIPLLRRRKTSNNGQSTRQTLPSIEPEIVQPWRPSRDIQ